MHNWAKEQKHTKDLKKAVLHSGSKLHKGTLIFKRINAKEFWEIFAADGHTRTIFEECKCKHE